MKEKYIVFGIDYDADCGIYDSIYFFHYVLNEEVAAELETDFYNIYKNFPYIDYIDEVGKNLLNGATVESQINFLEQYMDKNEYENDNISFFMEKMKFPEIKTMSTE